MAEIFSSDNLWSKGLNGGVKHAHTLMHTKWHIFKLYTPALMAVLSLCSIEILLSSMEVILLQEVTPREGCLFQEVTWWECVARAPASMGGILLLSTWAHAPQEVGRCKPTRFLFLCFCPKTLIRLRMGRLIGLLILHIHAALHPVPIKTMTSRREDWRHSVPSRGSG